MSGFDLIKSYPMHAETRTGAHTSNKNSIALDIMLICKKKSSKAKNTIDDDLRIKIEEDTYKSIDSILDRLTAIGAEITIPDIENIFISEYVHSCYINEINLSKTLDSEKKNRGKKKEFKQK